MEARFARTFGHIRVHDDAAARAEAVRLDASAFTIGQHIYFRRSADHPRAAGPSRLLAHELAHTIQQYGASDADGRYEPGPAYEAEAHAAAKAAVRGEGATVRRRLGAKIVQRHPHDGDAGHSHEQTAPPVSDAELRARYIRRAREQIRVIREAVEAGRVWAFEEEDLLLGSELLEEGVEGLRPPESVVERRGNFGRGPGQGSTIQRRLVVLANVVCNLQTLIETLEQGEGLPTRPAARASFDVFYLDFIFTRGLGTELVDWARWVSGGEGSASQDWGEYPYALRAPGSTPVLRSAELPWWTCDPTPHAGSQTPPQRETPRRLTDYWVHIPDAVRHPAAADYVETPSPRSSLYLRPPGSGGPRLERHGQSFPVWHDAQGYFYFLGDRRIDLPHFDELPVL